MTSILEDLDFIASRIVETGGELPVFASVGLGAWKELNSELLSRWGGQSSSANGFVTINAYLSTGSITIRPDHKLPLDFVGIGRITKNDIIIEDILLDDETYSDLDSSN
jgi:hypothetical protein